MYKHSNCYFPTICKSRETLAEDGIDTADGIELCLGKHVSVDLCGLDTGMTE